VRFSLVRREFYRLSAAPPKDWLLSVAIESAIPGGGR
jgi:hypothetical protein